MEKFRNAVLYTGGTILVIAAASLITGSSFSRYLYCIGAVLFCSAQLTMHKSENLTLTLKRLYVQQGLGCLFLLGTGALLFTDILGKNAWIVTLTIGAIIQLYSIVRIEHEIKKNSLEED